MHLYSLHGDPRCIRTQINIRNAISCNNIKAFSSKHRTRHSKHGIIIAFTNSDDNNDALKVRDDGQLLSDEQPPHHTQEPATVPLTSPARLVSDTIIILDSSIFVSQLFFPQITLFGVKANELIDHGQIWRLITPAFLHGSFPHLILNMISLHSLGPVCEWTSGRHRFTAIYLVSAFAGNLVSYAASPDPSLGASGAIFGLSGALLVFFLRNKQLFGTRYNKLTLRLAAVVALNFGIGFVLPQIDEWGHIGGFLGGALIAYLLGPSYEVCMIKGREGVWLVDDPPVDTFSTPPRKMIP